MLEGVKGLPPLWETMGGSFLREGKVRAQDVQWTSVLCGPKRSEEVSVLAQDYPSAPANPSSLAKRDARGYL